MADQTFTPGQILTASQMTTLQENSGLSYIKSQTIGSAVSSVTVTSAFSADFDNYKILVNDFQPTAATQFVLTLNGITTNYSFQLNYGSFNSTASALGSTGGSQWEYVTGTVANQKNSSDIDLYSPFLSSQKRIRSVYIDNTVGGQMFGFNSNTTSCTAFTLTLGSGTMTGGTIAVYGYRKA